MLNLCTLISETFDTLSAHVDCAAARVPLPDKELKNLREFHNGWRYDTEDGGYVEHNTTSHGARTPGEGYITHYNKHGKIHHDEGPAVIHSSGAKIWVNNGVRQGTYNPVYSDNASKEDTFYDNEDAVGKKVSREEFVKKHKGL